MQISMQELQALIDFIREQGFFDPVAAASAHSADSAQESHPATTIVTVRDGEVRTRSVTDLRHAPRQDGFRAIVTRLERLIDITLLGGYPAADDWLTRANAELAAVHPAAAPLTLADFASGARRIDGSVNVVFARELDGVKVSMAVDAAGRYGVAVFPQP